MPITIPSNRTITLASKAGGGFQSAGLVAAPSGDETLFYEMEFSGTQPLYQGSGNAHPGGGYIAFLADPTPSLGSGLGGTNIYYDTVNDDPLFTGTIPVLRNTYFASGASYNFANQTLFGNHPVSQKVYKRLRIKWSSNWEWGSDQLKFCKNKGPGDFETNCPKFDGSGSLYVTKADPFGGYEQFVYPTQAQADAQANPDYYIADDINNGFGVGSTDAAWSPQLDTWYWLEWEIDTGTPGSSEGSYKIWIDGNLYFQLDNVQVNQVGHGGFDYFELGHVWQVGFPSQDISMYWHSLAVYDKRPSVLPEGIA